MGPVLFGTLADITGQLRYAILIVILFYAAGFFLLRRVQAEAG
jgi:MFS-type transporter involved in bile tolerance (Atg22 family)